MSVRQMIAQLTEAKNQLQRAKAAGAAVATTVLEARAAIDTALDGVQDKTLGDDITKHADAFTTELAGIDGLTRGIENTIQRTQGIGGRR